MTKKEAYIDWISKGVKYGVITLPKAKRLYEEKYAKMTKPEFEQMMVAE
jgi:hypothetical protein